MRVDVFQHKVIYDIPLGRETIFKNLKIEIKDNSIKLTTYQAPILPHSVKLSYDNSLVVMEPSVGNDKYSLSHQQVFHEMK